MYVLAPGIEPLQFDVPRAASREAVMQIVEVRRALEAEVAELAALRRDPGPAAGGCFAAAGVLSGSGDASTDFFTRAFAQLQA